MGAPERTVLFKEEIRGGVLIMRMRGRLDALSSTEAEKKICDSADSGQWKVVLDMSGVTYVSSAGLRMLLSSTKKLRSYSGKLALCSTTPNVLDMLKISGFDHVLELYKTEEEALKLL